MSRLEGADALRARMARTPAASPEDARRTNRSLVLRALHLGGPTSRAELAKLLHLTPATVSSVVRELLDDGIVDELGRTAARHVGKPATLVGIRPDGRHLLALDLSAHDHFTGALVDLDGKLVARVVHERHDRTGDDAIEMVVAIVEELTSLAERPLLGIGIASPGYIDETDTIVNATHLAWERVDLARRLTTETALPVHVVNDANASALAELSFGDGMSRDLVVVRVDEGVGAGLVLDGTLHIGKHGGGGEIGHVVVDPDGAPCVCGKRGCLETLVSEPLISHRRAGVDDLDVLVAAGTALGRGIAMLVSAVDVADIVLSGAMEVLGQPFQAAVHDAVRAMTLPDFAERLTVRSTSFLDNDVVLGAAALVLDRELGIR